MLKSKKLLVGLIAIISVMVLSLSSFVYAETATSGNTTNENSTVLTTEGYAGNTTANATSEGSIDYNSIKKEDQFLCDTNVTIDNVVSGNIFIMANNVTINNVVDGNIFVMADNVTVTDKAYVYSDMYIFAKTVNIAGYVYDIYDASNTFTLEKTGYIIRDLHAGCENLNLNGYIRRDANIHCSKLNLDPSSAKIGGNLNYSAENEINLDNSIVTGKIAFTKNNNNENTAILSKAFSTFGSIATFTYYLLAILIIVLAMPKFSDKCENILTTKFWACLGFGLLGLVLVPIIVGILAVTLVGAYAAFALCAIYLLVLSLCVPIASVALGKLICTKINKTNKGIIFVISLAVSLALLLVVKVKYIGGIIGLLASIIGFGIIIHCIFPAKQKKDKVQEPLKESEK